MKPETIFDNFFDSIHITATRLHNFAEGSLNRLEQDTTGNWKELIGALEPLSQKLGRELGEVDTTINVRMGRTDTVDEVIKSVAAYMSENEPFIARALGGRKTPAYIEFYPAGISEYNRINKTTAPVLLERIAKAGEKYAAELGKPYASELPAFEQDYHAVRNAQQGIKGNVDENRTDRSEARKALELGLLRAIYLVGAQYPGDVERCSSFFDFERLYSVGRHKKQDGEERPGAQV